MGLFDALSRAPSTPSIVYSVDAFEDAFGDDGLFGRESWAPPSTPPQTPHLPSPAPQQAVNVREPAEANGVALLKESVDAWEAAQANGGAWLQERVDELPPAPTSWLEMALAWIRGIGNLFAERMGY